MGTLQQRCLLRRGEAIEVWRPRETIQVEFRPAVQQAVAADNPAAGTSCRIEAPTRRRACR